MLRAENRGHNSPAAQTSVPCPPTHSPGSHAPEIRHPGPETVLRWGMEGARGKERMFGVCGGNVANAVYFGGVRWYTGFM